MVPFVDSVFHPSDFSAQSDGAFAHALAIAVRRRARLTMLHVVGHNQAADVWAQFPAVRGTLQKWGVLDPGSPRSAVFDTLGVDVKKINVRGNDVAAAISSYLDRNPSDLIVLATEGREGLPRWVQNSIAERLARRSRTKTLFVPRNSRGFVSPETGAVALRRILVPYDLQPDPHAAIAYTLRVTAMLDGTAEVRMLHVGENPPRVELPAEAESWQLVRGRGAALDGILNAAREFRSDLIVMATEGHEGVLDALRGSVTEKVLRRSPCAVLAVPVG